MRIARIGLLLLGASAPVLAASAAPATLALSRASSPAAAAKPREILPFIENDYPKALADARAKKLPIFAEAWAPW